MLNYDEGIAFLYDVGSSVHILLCKYCKTTNYLNLKY
jgi:hypothetical protein